MSRARPGKTLSHAATRRFYDQFGKKLDSQGFYENPALSDLLANLDLGTAHAIVEFGCGTGRLAAEVLQALAPPDAHYLGIDISATMVALARERLQPFADRARVMQGNGELRVEVGDASFDRFLCTYVLDLLSPEDARALLNEARRVLKPGGLLGMTSLSANASGVAGLVSRLWYAVFSLSPKLTGGCRPVRISALFDPAHWQITHSKQVAPFAIASDVIVARLRP